MQKAKLTFGPNASIVIDSISDKGTPIYKIDDILFDFQNKEIALIQRKGDEIYLGGWAVRELFLLCDNVDMRDKEIE